MLLVHLRMLRYSAIGILASPTWADGQSGRTRPGKDQVRPLAPLVNHSRFRIEPVAATTQSRASP
jgi:hypothetical protein